MWVILYVRYVTIKESQMSVYISLRNSSYTVQWPSGPSLNPCYWPLTVTRHLTENYAANGSTPIGVLVILAPSADSYMTLKI